MKKNMKQGISPPPSPPPTISLLGTGLPLLGVSFLLFLPILSVPFSLSPRLAFVSFSPLDHALGIESEV